MGGVHDPRSPRIVDRNPYGCAVRLIPILGTEVELEDPAIPRAAATSTPPAIQTAPPPEPMSRAPPACSFHFGYSDRAATMSSSMALMNRGSDT